MKKLSLTIGSVLSVAGLAIAGDALPRALKGADSWACRESHPAVVNAAVAEATENVISLRGEWDFVMTKGFARGRRNSHDIPFFLETDAWKNPGKIVVPGCWEAQLPPEPGMSQSWEFKYDHSPKTIRNPAIGEGWYRRFADIPADWAGKRVWIKVGGVKSCAWIWVNRQQAAFVQNYCGTCKYDVTDCVKPGERAEIIVEASNVVPSRKGVMSAMHRWGGIYRDIELEATPQVFIDEAWVRGDFDERLAEAHVEIAGLVQGLKFKVRATVEGETVERSIEHSNNPNNQAILKIPLRDFRPWSPEHPNLYTAKVELVENGQVVHSRRERFGFRKLEVRGKELYLNNRPFFARGFGDDSVYPLTGVSPADRAFHLEHLKRARAAGFNFVRLHTHCELPEYFEAADEAGILIEAELPYINGDIPVEHFAFDPVGDTLELYRNYRRHPSFAVYSGGNEGSFGKALDRELYRLVKSIDPDRLKICQDTQMARFNTVGNSDFTGGPVAEWPRGSVDPDRPFVCHEYLNLCVKLDSRTEGDFTGAWMPPTTRAERAAWLGKFGLDQAWGDRLQDAQHKQQAYWQKHGVECARSDPHCDGFCFWTIADVVVKQFDAYTSQGLFDPFWRPKRGGWTPEGFAKFNSPTCVLADFRPGSRVLVSGDCLQCDLLLSHYGERPLENATLRWKMVADGRVLQRGDLSAGDQPLGPVRKVGSAEILVPAVERPVKATFVAEIGEAANAWDVWVFPRRERRRLSGVVASRSLLPALGRLYDGIRPADGAKGCRVAILTSDDPLRTEFLGKGAHVVSLGPVNRSKPRACSTWSIGTDVDRKVLDAFDCGSDDYCLGWWFMGHQVGVAIRESPLLGELPHDGCLSPLLFRIVGGGRPLPASDVGADDLVMVGEGGKACSAYISSRSSGFGRLTEVNGLDLLSGYPEGTCILDGMIDASEEDALTVLTWNTEHYGWEEQPPEQAALREQVMFDVIRDSGADIVLIQETYGSFERFKNGLRGFEAVLHNSCNSLFSRYPIIDTRILVSDRKYKTGVFDFGISEIDCNGRRIRVGPIAMNWQPYGAAMTMRIGDFRSAEELLAWERAEQPNGGTPRPQAIVDVLASLERQRAEADRIPLVIGGDFNSQSHLDWTEETASMPEHGGLTVPWTVSLRMLEAGFADTFRALNPDPARAYGSTFPRTEKGEAGHDVRLRYDFIYSLGKNLKPIASECCTGRYLKPFSYRGRDYPLFPSDHGFVVTKFRWERGD